MTRLLAPLGIPPGYRGLVADTDFLGHLAVMEMLSLPPGRPRPWKRAVVVEDTGSRRAAEYPAWLAAEPRVLAERFEQRWQEITSRLEVAWINIVPTAVEDDTPRGRRRVQAILGSGPFRRPDQIAIPGHQLPPEQLPAVESST